MNVLFFKKVLLTLIAAILTLSFVPNTAKAQHGDADGHAHTQSDPHAINPVTTTAPTHSTPTATHAPEGEKKLDIGDVIVGHISDANQFHIVGNWALPLPCIVYNKTRGNWDFFMSSVFEHGHKSYNGYVLDHHGSLQYVSDPNFLQQGSTPVEVHKNPKTKNQEALYNGHHFEANRSNIYDFSITKNVFTMLMSAVLLLLVFGKVSAAYRSRGNGVAPKGLQGFFEVIVLFIREEVAKPNLGKHYEKFLPYLLTVFFFIWFNNIFGLIPFFPGGSNVMGGSILTTAVLSFFTFIAIKMASTKHFWAHIFNPPGVPIFVKPIVVLIEFLSVFIKPIALMIRLFANILAGHIMILSLVGLIFIFAGLGGAAAGFGASIVSCAFMLFIYCLELLVSVLQAYIFTMLSAVFIGQAMDEGHAHTEEAAHH